MRSFGSSIGLFVLGISSFSACKREEPAPQVTPSPSAIAATTAPAVATAAAAGAAAPAATPSKPLDEVCPFPRRCADGCKNAHFAALDACSAEWKVIEKAMPNVKEMGECTARCLTSVNTAGCVGAATQTECDCIHKCADGVPPALKEKGEPYLRCYANAVAAACY